jgi:transposase
VLGSLDAAATRIAELEIALAAERERAATANAERDRFREAYQQLKLELELMRRRLFVAKAERIDVAQLELEFAGKLAALDALNQQLGAAELTGRASVDDTGADGGAGATPPPRGRKPTGRREVRDMDLPEERIELPDPTADEGTKPICWEESCRIAWRRGGMVRLVVARAKYREVDTEDVASTAADQATIEPMVRIHTTPMPPTILPRSIASASLLAHIISEKFCDGLPFNRQADRFARLGVPIDRSLMSRWAEELGQYVGSSVVEAMREEALRTAFCISTDATGILVQPIQGGEQPRRGCRRGHFFVQIADADHVFFEYVPRETSAAVGELFRGFTGYVQADAKSVYDLLFKPPGERPPDDGEPDLGERHEVGCWSHYPEPSVIWSSDATSSVQAVARSG